jgi:cysteine desulfurase
MNRIFLDWASTAPPLPLAVEAQRKTMVECFGNPSSLHREGREAKALLEESRALVARAAGALPGEVVFTSGATESNNMVVAALLKKIILTPAAGDRRRVILSVLEHASLWEPVRALKQAGFDIALVKPEPSGHVRPDAVAALLDERTVFVALMLVNNETGAVEPVRECVQAVRDFTTDKGARIHVHTDAVQAFGKIWFSFHELGVDTLSVSAHKLGGPRGAGALLVNKSLRPDYLFLGGGQEGNRRPGTENLAAWYAFAMAAKYRVDNIDVNQARAARLMDTALAGIRTIPGIVLLPAERHGNDGRRYSPYILSFAAPPVPGEVLVRSLDDQGIAVSTGAACQTSKKESTRVIEALGVPKGTAASAVRISIGPETDPAAVDALLDALRETVPPLLKMAKHR